jgi:8-oxo-dGTP pyrophosphatase MutT (NUDIX family)
MDLEHWQRARDTVAAYRPPDAAQGREQRRILEFLDRHPDALHRTCLAGHLTAAALVVDAAGERALLTHHRKLGRWLQLGGHLDGNGDLAAGALREAEEESGIRGLRVEPAVLDLDVHPIPARGVEPQHWHLDVRFLVHAPPGAVEQLSDESLALGWFAPADLSRLRVDESVARLFRLVFGAP